MNYPNVPIFWDYTLNFLFGTSENLLKQILFACLLKSPNRLWTNPFCCICIGSPLRQSKSERQSGGKVKSRVPLIIAFFFSNRHHCSAFDQYFPVLIEEKKWKWKTIEAQKSESDKPCADYRHIFLLKTKKSEEKSFLLIFHVKVKVCRQLTYS